jgi:riboflavin synthase
MFSGIVEECGTVVSFERRGNDSRRLVIGGNVVTRELAQGDSISVDGCCLTAVKFDEKEIHFDLLEQTVRCTRFGSLQTGDRVNLERSVRLDGKMGGHYVSGHIDHVGTVVSFAMVGGDGRLEVEIPEESAKYLVEKGSIALNGVSLTLAEVAGRRFVVWLIPHTLRLTNLGDLSAGTPLNVEIDLLAKHVGKLIAAYLPKGAI